MTNAELNQAKRIAADMRSWTPDDWADWGDEYADAECDGKLHAIQKEAAKLRLLEDEVNFLQAGKHILSINTRRGKEEIDIEGLLEELKRALPRKYDLEAAVARHTFRRDDVKSFSFK